MKPSIYSLSLSFAVATVLSSCSTVPAGSPSGGVGGAGDQQFYGTDEPFAAEAVYFLLTDRFVDGDPANNHTDQGGELHSFDRPLHGPDGRQANIGYLGGDFKGILNNAGYIRDMGFTAIWLTPIVDNPDQAFSGGEPLSFGAHFKDGGKTGYHGYWGVNFYRVDEHLPSPDLSFAELTQRLRGDYGLKLVLDVVANHGSPAYSMPVDQPKYGEIYDAAGTLLADHQNLHPRDLDGDNPLHQFYNHAPGLLQLSDIDENNPAALDYFVGAYLQWIDQGAHALRIDTIKEMPHHFWKKFTDRIRRQHADIFMFAESYSFDADFIAEHTRPENGAVSVLDFPGRKAITGVFENPGSDYASILSYLHLTDGTYANPYELMTFYDNHDMARMNAADSGFINANNWLFTSRGIPVIYYGSEVNFMTGAAEHAGNRNYFGQQRIERAKSHPVHSALTTIANLRKASVALQRGLQINLDFGGDRASFYRVYQQDGVYQTALVLLNKGGQAADFEIAKWLNQGRWREAIGGEVIEIDAPDQALKTTVGANGVKVFLLDRKLNHAGLIRKCRQSQERI